VHEQLDGPAFQQAFHLARRVVEIRVVPHGSAQHAETGYRADVDGDARVRGLRRIVPGDVAGVRDARAVREIRIDDGPEPEHGGRARHQRTVRRAVVGGQGRAGEAHAGGEPVQRRRLVDIGQVARV